MSEWCADPPVPVLAPVLALAPSGLLPAVPPGRLLAALWDVVGVEAACVEERAELRVRPTAVASVFPFTSGDGRELGALCLREGVRGGGGDGSLFAITRDDTRLFLSGLRRRRSNRWFSFHTH